MPTEQENKKWELFAAKPSKRKNSGLIFFAVNHFHSFPETAKNVVNHHLRFDQRNIFPSFCAVFGLYIFGPSRPLFCLFSVVFKQTLQLPNVKMSIQYTNPRPLENESPPISNLIKHCTTLIYDSRIVLTRKLPILWL